MRGRLEGDGILPPFSLSRSPRPKDWLQTSMAEQAEDAATLVRVLGVAPAAVVGASLGAHVALGSC